ncbi:MAG: hypothetical protein JOZ49_19590 [Mycolicibacterium sp.]|nr:hypothetical protein [Mycolicibacterium sp.]
MSGVLAPEVLADPIGVMVGLVEGREPVLDREIITSIAERVAGGRAKRRRIAQALLNRPTVLHDGRSPAPRAVGDLLIALNKAGARHISLPACVVCGKLLRSFERRGEHWYCGVCGPRRELCAACGRLNRVSCRDRNGSPRCSQCPPNDGRDPTSDIVGLVARLDPCLPAEVIAAATRRAAPKPAQRHRLLWALQDHPDLLTGAGAAAPVPTVLRLIDELCGAGAHAIVRPACPGCRRVIRLHRPIGGRWLCRNCTAKSRAQPCARCGAVREAATRDEHGRPLCPSCLVVDPVNQEVCVKCRRRRPVSVRTPDGPCCPSCRPLVITECSICRRTARCEVSMVTGQPWCTACQQRWARCGSCGHVRPVRGGTIEDPRCAECTRSEPGFFRTCPGCGHPGRLRTKRCARCTVRQRARKLFADKDGNIGPELEDLYRALIATDRPDTVAAWLDRGGGPAILRQLDEAGAVALSHEALDTLTPGKPVEHLRSVLVAIGVLPHRDERMIQLQRWSAELIAGRGDAEERSLLHRSAVWHVIRRLRGRIGDADATHRQVVAAKRNIKGAVALLDWLTAKGLSLDTAGQGDLDAWLTSTEPLHSESGNFVRWARKHKLTRLEHGADRWGGPAGVIDTETRWQQARWLLDDDAVATADRVAALLVLLYAQTAASISELTVDHIQVDDQQVMLRLGREPILIPAPLDDLVRELVNARSGHAAVGGHHASPWLFPGGRPGQPLSAFRMTERLRKLGIRTSRARSAALFQLAADLPAAILARTLGIHISVAATWQRASAGDWLSYAAEISRRTKDWN